MNTSKDPVFGTRRPPRNPHPIPTELPSDEEMLAILKTVIAKPLLIHANRLIAIVRGALTPLVLKKDADDNVFFANGEREPFDKEVADVSRLMIDLIKFGSQIDISYIEDIKHADVDPVYAAAFLLLENTGAAERLTEAFRTIARVKLPRQPENRGRKPVQDAVYMLVRAAVFFRHQLKQDYLSKWDSARKSGAETGSRRTDEELKPMSETAELVCALARACGIQADHATLKGVLERYLKQLDGEGRKPMRADTLCLVFEDAEQV